MASFDSRISDISYAFQAPSVVELISEITKIVGNQVDPSFYAGGISSMEHGQFLNPHIDNSHDGNRERYRTLNLLFYTSPDWKEEYGGNLELWDTDVRTSTTITSMANRLVVMETNSRSWHSVSPLQVKQRRNCISNYYFSPRTPETREYFNVTKFSARPEQHFRRIIMLLDGFLRNSIRRFIPSGLAKEDVNKD
jgi:Rps23 Pro-64 3,4-dihydroxylase Tpa1-like proline 4-hydroxylase